MPDPSPRAPLRLLFFADGRSPIALNWIRYFIRGGHEVHLVSSFPCQPEPGLASFHEIRVAFSGLKAGKGLKSGRQAGAQPERKSFLWGGATVGLRTAVRQWLGPFTLPSAARQLLPVVREINPDLVHAMRIPYEGMVAGLARSLALRENTPGAFPPLLISTWGNDFTLHASKTPWMAAYTRLAMRQAAALHTDCFRDRTLAEKWDFDPQKPSVVLPGGGGLQAGIFYPPAERPSGPPVIINPRGIRAYVRNDTFFRSLPLILARYPDARILCPTMADESQARRWVADLNLSQSVSLLPVVSRSELADLFRQAHIAVSPSVHDGTPNTLLEAMACGCFPVAGDIPSICEWIEHGKNGFLIDPADPRLLANAVISALDQPALRLSAQSHNARLIAARAEYTQVMQQSESFYYSLI